MCCVYPLARSTVFVPRQKHRRARTNTWLASRASSQGQCDNVLSPQSRSKPALAVTAARGSESGWRPVPGWCTRRCCQRHPSNQAAWSACWNLRTNSQARVSVLRAAGRRRGCRCHIARCVQLASTPPSPMAALQSGQHRSRFMGGGL